MAQWRAREDILAATPHNIGAPERAARQCMPIDCCAATAAQAVAAYLVRFKQKFDTEAGGAEQMNAAC